MAGADADIPVILAREVNRKSSKLCCVLTRDNVSFKRRQSLEWWCLGKEKSVGNTEWRKAKKMMMFRGRRGSSLKTHSGEEHLTALAILVEFDKY